MASEMLAHGPPSGLCCLAVSNHNMCLNAPARQLTEQNPHAAQWSAPSRHTGRAQAPLDPLGSLRGRCLVELSEISSLQTIKTKGNQAPSRPLGDFLSSLSSLTTLSLNPTTSCLDDACFTQTHPLLPTNLRISARCSFAQRLHSVINFTNQNLKPPKCSSLLSSLLPPALPLPLLRAPPL